MSYRLFMSVSLPRPSVMLSPIIANPLDSWETQPSMALIKYLSITSYQQEKYFVTTMDVSLPVLSILY
jgi:hypothetical protein